MTPEWQAAVEQGDARALQLLVKDGADPDTRDAHGQTALMLAAHKGHVEATAFLIEAGADLNTSAKFGLTATMLAVIGSHESVARALADAGANLSARGTGAPGFAGKTAADLAREKDLQELAARLEPGGPAT